MEAFVISVIAAVAGRVIGHFLCKLIDKLVDHHKKKKG